ncbi:hypothetical protein [Alkalibacterium olivapovliticus]|uniref:Uncharacterized protein n=1 Tax=Alkalibacterium olivapovliticus TaxID=99907 RepID=A0A2T0W0W3_9LACT|nr:hypothetical protein [Alkalibacterium olivapovliticus]PRY78648.1 hypothetical protein CLV38_12519 [Alkalibacterium olivapovliticus]
MKKLIGPFIAVLVLMACSSPEAGISELDNAPEDITDFIAEIPAYVPDSTASDMRLLSFNDGDNGSYVVFFSSGQVEADTHTEGDTLVINMTETDLADEQPTQYTYYLTISEEHEAVEVRVNGENTPFDLVAGL